MIRKRVAYVPEMEENTEFAEALRLALKSDDFPNTRMALCKALDKRADLIDVVSGEAVEQSLRNARLDKLDDGPAAFVFESSR